MDSNPLEKYWDAKTSLQEEQHLTEQMAGSPSPEADYFRVLADFRHQKSKLTFEDIKAYNQRQEQYRAAVTPKTLPLYRWIASAAAVLMFVVAGIGVWNYSHQLSEPAQMAETFEDPYEAYEEMREALAFVSSKLNKSQNEALLNIKKAGEYAEIFK